MRRIVKIVVPANRGNGGARTYTAGPMPPTSLAPKRVSRAARTYLADLWGRREFAWYLAMGNLKARNASTTLGLFWWVLNPLLLGSVYWLVFGLIFDRGTLDVSSRALASGEELPFLAYLLSGMFPFYFTQTSMTGGVNSIVSNARLMVNLSFPRLILPIAALIESAVGFLTSVGVFFVVVGLVNGIWPGVWTLWLIPTIVIHIVFNFGLSTIVARIAVPFRDLNNLVPYFTRLWLYLSPILYQASFLEGKGTFVETAFRLNPLFAILELYRYSFAGVETNLGSTLLIAMAWAVGLSAVGASSFIKYEGKMARYL